MNNRRAPYLPTGMNVYLIFFSTFSLLLTPTNGASQIREPSSECGLYLAASTIPNAGLGMFAGKDFKKGEKLADGDIIIPYMELSWHNGNNDEDVPFIYDDYNWGSETIKGMPEEEVRHSEDIKAASNGIGSVINCRRSMVNIELSENKVGNAGLHRSKSPGAGAITPYYDWHGIATEDIPSGRELYVDYGQNYFDTREHTYGLIPSEDDFEEADELLETFEEMLPEESSSTRLRQDLLDLIQDCPYESAVVNAFPTNASLIDHVVQVGTAKQYEVTRDISWLEEHGTCMDNTKPGDSTIKDAGRGAFAARFIPRGSIVAPVPVLHIANKTRMLMYDWDDNGTKGQSPVHEQLLVNYCFGHPNSSILLSPYGMFTGLINHSSKKPNVRVEWSRLSMHPEWRNLSLKELETHNHAGLAFDYVALRDILEGEEILLDYGREWEEAWNQHVAKWKPPKNADSYVPAFELEDDVNSIIRTIHEQPYSDNVLLYFHNEYWSMLLGIYGDDEDEDQWLRPRVLDRYQDDNNETVYMVEIFYDMDDAMNEMTIVTYDKEILFGVPRDAFQFCDAPYTRDHHNHESFRHPMTIPSDIMPEAWLDLQ